MKKIIRTFMVLITIVAGISFIGCSQDVSSGGNENPSPKEVDGKLTVNDFYSYDLDDYQFITMTDEKLSFVYEIELNNPGDTYIILDTDMNDYMRYMCRRKTGSRCDCKFILRDSKGNPVKIKWQDGNEAENGTADDVAFSFICPEEKGTYYLEIIPYSNDNRGKSGVYLYHGKPITDFTLNSTNVTVGLCKTVNIPFTYTGEGSTNPNGFCFYAIPSGEQDENTDYCIPASCVVNTDGTGYVTVYGILPGSGSFTLRDGVSDKQVECNVTVSLDSTASYDSITPGTSISPSEDDITAITFEDYAQSKIFELNLTKDVNYIIDSYYQGGDYYYFLYNSTGAKLSEVKNGSLYCKPDTSGKYYLLVKHHDKYSDGLAKVYPYSVTTISSLAFANSQETLKIGESNTLTVNYTGNSDIPLVFEIENDNSHIYIEQIEDNENGTVSFKLAPLNPVNSDIYLIEKVSGLKAGCRIKSELVDSDAITFSSSAIGTQPSLDQNDYTKIYVHRMRAIYYKLELEADKKYHLEVFDSCVYARMFETIPENFSLADGLFYLYDASGNIVKVNTQSGELEKFDGADSDYDGTYTPSASGTYYLLITLYTPNGSTEGDVYFHIYKEN